MFWAILILLVVLSYYILQSYIIALVSAFILAYLIKPVYNLMKNKINKKLSAVLCIIMLFLTIMIPIFWIFKQIIQQAYSSIAVSDLNVFIDKLSSTAIFQKLNIDLSLLSQNVIPYFISLLKSTIFYIPSFLISVTITLIGTYFILTNWEYLSSSIRDFIPFQDKDRIIKEIAKMTDGIIYGTILIGILEFVVSAFGFYALGINSYLLLSLLIFIFAFIPGGPGIVWVPLLVYEIYQESYITALGVLIIGLVISFYIDTILRTQILGKKSNVNEFIMLLGVLGGVSVFGLFGFIIGPIILVYTIKLLQENLRQQ